MAHPSLVEEFKDKVLHLLGQQPFQAFRIVMDSGDVLNVDHPENFSMWPGPEANTFHLYAEGGRAIYGHFAKVTAVEARQRGSHG